MQPEKSFWIWFSPRTGSTLLCKALEETGVCGKAGEFFFEENKTLLEQCQAIDYPGLRERIRSLGMSKNGILGVKHSIYAHLFLSHARELKRLRQMPEAHDLDWNLWSDMFPNCTHIYLTRRNNIHQSVSWWKAIQDQQWHLEKEASHEKGASYYHDKYNFDALMHLLKECMLREAMAESFFDHNQLVPYTIVYEDLIRDYTGTIDQIIGHIGIMDTYTIREKPYNKTTNEINQAWIRQFKNDLQKNWERIMW